MVNQFTLSHGKDVVKLCGCTGRYVLIPVCHCPVASFTDPRLRIAYLIFIAGSKF